jgi:hypothetical protein
MTRFAELDEVLLAIETLATVDEGIHRHPITGLEVVDSRADLFHHADELVPHHHRCTATGQRVGLFYRNKERTMQILFKIRAADAAPGNLHLDAIGGQLAGVWKWLDANVVLLMPDGCFHCGLL